MSTCSGWIQPATQVGPVNFMEARISILSGGGGTAPQPGGMWMLRLEQIALLPPTGWKPKLTRRYASSCGTLFRAINSRL